MRTQTLMFALCVAVASHAAVFDFESDAIGSYASGVHFENQGVGLTVVSAGGWVQIAHTGIAGNLGQHSVFANNTSTGAFLPFQPIVFVFDHDITQAELRAGDFGGDDDGNILVNLFDESNNYLGTLSQYYGYNRDGLSFDIQTPFRKVVVDTDGTSTPHSVAAEFTSVTAAPVPEPVTLGLMSLGVLGLMRRRRRFA